ncbi:lymphoid enhancer-binding factor 1-like isoform X2 [Salarias fasciatus]|uniref:lymphoid enhancer-binding factor 1-like isoform X2 n=1 Tax=Salarias fasciatus TaxID=181472 RepID=UPI0011764F2E|nr:lymphoid enhancer-binding factor 1-like isoform X2 [Salarias fasciatus]
MNASTASTEHAAQRTTYIKKPPNAFMLYLKELRPVVEAEIGDRNSALVNAEVARRWKLLPAELKEKYYLEAKIEQKIHEQQHPDWSYKTNYKLHRLPLLKNKRLSALTTSCEGATTAAPQWKPSHATYKPHTEKSPIKLQQ